MKKSKLATWIIAKFGAWLQKEEPPRHEYLTDFDRITFEVRPADVLLVEGRHRISNIIRHITLSPWTHSALYIGRLHDIKDEKLREKVREKCHCSPEEQLLIESIIGKGTIISPLSKYRHDNLRLCRPVGLSHQDAQKVIAYAIGRLGSKYNMRQIFDLFRFLFPWGLWPRRWRSSLFQHNAQQPTEDICSSMIAQAFAAVNFPILPLVKKEKETYELIQRNPRLFTPSDFDYSPYFSIIKYPIFPLGEPAAYHKLPWKVGVISDDQGRISPLPDISQFSDAANQSRKIP